MVKIPYFFNLSLLKIQTCKGIIVVIFLSHLLYLAANEKRQKEMKEGKERKLEIFFFS